MRREEQALIASVDTLRSVRWMSFQDLELEVALHCVGRYGFDHLLAGGAVLVWPVAHLAAVDAKQQHAQDGIVRNPDRPAVRRFSREIEVRDCSSVACSDAPVHAGRLRVAGLTRD